VNRKIAVPNIVGGTQDRVNKPKIATGVKPQRKKEKIRKQHRTDTIGGGGGRTTSPKSISWKKGVERACHRGKEKGEGGGHSTPHPQLVAHIRQGEQTGSRYASMERKRQANDTASKIQVVATISFQGECGPKRAINLT